MEDPTRAPSARKQVNLIGDPRTSRIDEPEDRQLIAQRYLGHPDDLLYRPRTPGAGFDAWVIGHHEGRPSLNQATTGDDAVGRQVVGHRVGELAVLNEGAVVEQQVDPLTHKSLFALASLAAARSVGASVRSRAALIWSMIDYSTGSPSRRAISSRCTSEVPSPISRTFASR